MGEKHLKTVYPDMLMKDGHLNLTSLIDTDNFNLLKGFTNDNGEFKYMGFRIESDNLFEESYQSDFFSYLINESIDSRDIDNLKLLINKKASLFKSYFYYGNNEAHIKFKDQNIHFVIIEHKNTNSKELFYESIKDYLIKRFKELENDYKEIMKNFDRFLYNNNYSYTSKDFYIDTFFYVIDKKGSSYYLYPVFVMMTKQKGVETQKYIEIGVLPDNKVYIPSLV